MMQHRPLVDASEHNTRCCLEVKGDIFFFFFVNIGLMQNSSTLFTNPIERAESVPRPISSTNKK